MRVVCDTMKTVHGVVSRHVVTALYCRGEGIVGSQSDIVVGFLRITSQGLVLTACHGTTTLTFHSLSKYNDLKQLCLVISAA